MIQAYYIQPSIILALIALIAALPNLVKMGVYYLYKPKLELFFPPPNRLDKIGWSELKGTPLNIRNRSLKFLTVEVEYISDKPLNLRGDVGRSIVESGLTGGYPLKGGFWFRTKSLHLAGNLVLAHTFPFEASSEDCSLEVKVYPTISLSEFGFPRYFGHVELKPIKKEFQITV